MKRWIDMAIKERKVTFLIAFLVLVYGVYAYYILPKQENPDTTSPTAQIITPYPGATTSEVEKQVTQKIETALSSLSGIEYMTSYSNPNASVVLITLNYSVDYQEEWDKMRIKLDGLKDELPEGVMPFIIDTDLTTSAGAIISVSGKSHTKEQLVAFTEIFQSELERISGVRRVTIDGVRPSHIEVVLDTSKMPIANTQVVDLLMAQNASLPAGDLVTASGRIPVQTLRRFESIRDIEETVVFGDAETGQIVKLKDIATVFYSEAASAHSYKYEDEEAVLMTLYFESDENIVLVGREVRDRISAIEKTMPESLHINELLFAPEEVNQAIRQFMINLIQGMLFVMGVVLVGMGIRNAVVVSTAIPLSIAATMIIMGFLGIDVQQMSIAALIIALGILVDNSIVISDSIQVRLDQGEASRSACFEGTKEASIPVLTSTLTTIAAFAPLMALPGEAGEFAKSLPQVVIISLIASYLVAMLVTPALASVFFKHKKIKRHAPKSALRNFFTTLSKGALSKRKTAIISLVLIIGATVYAVQFLEIALFPYADKDIFYIDLYANRSGDIAQTEALTQRVYEKLQKYDGIETVYTSIGGSFPKFYLTVGTRPPSDDYAQMVIKVSQDLSQDLERFAFDLQRELDGVLTMGRASVNLLEINQPGPAVDVKIFGTHREDIDRVADEVYQFFSSDPSTIKVNTDQPERRYQYVLDIDREKAAQFALTPYEIKAQVFVALSGLKATTIASEQASYDIVVKNDITDLDDLYNLPVFSSHTGASAYLKQMATVTLGEEWGSVKRHNRQPAVFVSTDLAPGASSTRMQEALESYLETSVDLTGVTIDFGGDKEIIDKYISDLLGAALIAVAIIYMILLIQFNSMIQPLIVLLSVPLSIVGSVFILLAFQMNITFTVGLGVASLIGIVVNNAILLIEYMNRASEAHESLYEACIAAVDRRFKPIVLSTVTTIIGLVPLALSGSSFFTPMALALMGGLFVSTFLTLVVIPLAYYIVENYRIKWYNR